MNSWASFKWLPPRNFARRTRGWMNKCGNEGPSVKSLNFQVWVGCLQHYDHDLVCTLGPLYCCIFATCLQCWLTSDRYIILQGETEIIFIPTAQLTYPVLKSFFCIYSSFCFFCQRLRDYKTISMFFFYKQKSAHKSSNLLFSPEICMQPNRS